ncbi:hypothetical protein H4P12_08375 [Paracoccus sp. 11-3]|uniref:Mor transcription activator family protein n=1 Tax=Paracoccus amoyensis TaxID=2760093 RepID=A0A926GB55_9RHOB|nr:hypothetical protein [Paracoccus amoyensis]MBC9246726.1 hypothetical protein [Paracoccus amoyensis]
MSDRQAAQFEDLPTSLVDIADALGLRVALKLMQNYGGMDVRFPARPKSDHPVIKALGETDAIALCHFLSGQSIYVPRRPSPGSVRADVHRMEAAGYDRAAIAQELRISMRHVRRLANGDQGDDRQADLFD